MLLLGKVGMGLAGVALAGAGIICSEGMISVNVQTRQPEKHHVYLIVPAMLVPIGMHFVPKENLAESSRELKPWMPTIRAAIDALDESDDITFVGSKAPRTERARGEEWWLDCC